MDKPRKALEVKQTCLGEIRDYIPIMRKGERGERPCSTSISIPLSCG